MINNDKNILKSSKMKKLLLIASLAFAVIHAYSQKYELSSPDAKLKAAVDINGGINVTLTKGDITAIKFGNIYLETGNKSQNTEFKVQRVFRSSRKRNY